jgi:chorismate dehydratase
VEVGYPPLKYPTSSILEYKGAGEAMLIQQPWRIGAVSYLNTKPLIYHLEKFLTNSVITLDLPSRLADRLACDELDVALIPSVEFLRGKNLSIVSNACIACHGPVRSVRVLFRCPPDQVKSLALDEGSRTSAALAQVLLAQRFGIRPQLQGLAINADFKSSPADAILIIGDRAMDVEEGDYYTTWDLGQQWFNETGLPFVFAMWVARLPLADEVAQSLEACRDTGLDHIDSIVAAEAPRYGLSTASCDEYFRKHLHFVLGSKELDGLNLFRDQANSIGLLDSPPFRVSTTNASPPNVHPVIVS